MTIKLSWGMRKTMHRLSHAYLLNTAWIYVYIWTCAQGEPIFHQEEPIWSWTDHEQHQNIKSWYFPISGPLMLWLWYIRSIIALPTYTRTHTHIHPTKTADIKTKRNGSRNMTESPKLQPDSNAIQIQGPDSHRRCCNSRKRCSSAHLRRKILSRIYFSWIIWVKNWVRWSHCSSPASADGLRHQMMTFKWNPVCLIWQVFFFFFF